MHFELPEVVRPMRRPPFQRDRDMVFERCHSTSSKFLCTLRLWLQGNKKETVGWNSCMVVKMNNNKSYIYVVKGETMCRSTPVYQTHRFNIFLYAKIWHTRMQVTHNYTQTHSYNISSAVFQLCVTFVIINYPPAQQYKVLYKYLWWHLALLKAAPSAMWHTAQRSERRSQAGFSALTWRTAVAYLCGWAAAGCALWPIDDGWDQKCCVQHL